MLRILMISGAFYPKVDGSVIAVANLTRELSKRGDEVTLLTRGYDIHSDPNEWHGAHVERVYQRGFSLLFRLLLVIELLRVGMRLTKGTRFDVIHAHGFSSLLTAEVLQIFSRTPVIVTFHGLQRLWNKNWNLESTIRFYFMVPFEGLLVRRANLVVAQSTKLRDALVRLYRVHSESAKVIPNPVDVSTFRYHTPSGHSKTILFVGTIGTIYGPDVLVRASQQVVRQIPEAQFVFVGAGPAMGQISNLASSLGVENHIRLVGRVTDREELGSYYATSRMLVIPFKGLGGYFLSLAALESMAVGRPVIVAYEIDDTPGAIHTSNEPSALAEKILEIMSMDDQSYLKLCEAARSSVENFSSENIARQLASSYQNLAGPRRNRSRRAFHDVPHGGPRETLAIPGRAPPDE